MIDPNSLPPQVLEALRRGNKIEAIKHLREATKLGLAEAKGVIDALEQGKPMPSRPSPRPAVGRPIAKPASHEHRRPRENDLSPGEVPRGGAFNPIAVVVLLVAAAFAAWWLLKS